MRRFAYVSFFQYNINWQISILIIGAILYGKCLAWEYEGIKSGTKILVLDKEKIEQIHSFFAEEILKPHIILTAPALKPQKGIIKPFESSDPTRRKDIIAGKQIILIEDYKFCHSEHRMPGKKNKALTEEEFDTDVGGFELIKSEKEVEFDFIRNLKDIVDANRELHAEVDFLNKYYEILSKDINHQSQEELDKTRKYLLMYDFTYTQISNIIGEFAQRYCQNEPICGSQPCSDMKNFAFEYDHSHESYILTSVTCLFDGSHPSSSRFGGFAYDFCYENFPRFYQREHESARKRDILTTPVVETSQLSHQTSVIPQSSDRGIFSYVSDYLNPRPILSFLAEKCTDFGQTYSTPVKNALTQGARKAANSLTADKLLEIGLNPYKLVTTVAITAGTFAVGYFAAQTFGLDSGKGINVLPDMAQALLEDPDNVYTPVQKSQILELINEAREVIFIELEKLKFKQRIAERSQESDEKVKPKEIFQSTSIDLNKLKQTNPRGANVLEALIAFTSFLPNKIAEPVPDLSSALESHFFIVNYEMEKNLRDMMQAYVKLFEYRLEGVSGDKYFYYAATGPGTGKSRGIRDVSEKIGAPFCVIKGEDLIKKIPEATRSISDPLQKGIAAYRVMEKAFISCFKEFQRNINGVVLWDDITDLLSYTDRKDNEYCNVFCRRMFWDLQKNLGDGNIHEVPVTLVEASKPDAKDGVEYNISTELLISVITLNELPPDMTSTGPEYLTPHRSRKSNLQADYQDEKKRFDIAYHFFIDEALKHLEVQLHKYFNEEGIELFKQNKQEFLEKCTPAIQKVVDADVENYLSKNRKVGIRTSTGVYKSYSGHVKEKINFYFKNYLENLKRYKDFSELFSSDICSFEPLPGQNIQSFDPKKKIQSGGDFDKGVNTQLEEAEKRQKLIEAMNDFETRFLREQFKLSFSESTKISSRIAKLKATEITSSNREQVENQLQKIEKMFSMSFEKIPPDPAELLLKRIDQKFGYLSLSTQKNDRVSEQRSPSKMAETDQFLPLKGIIAEIHKKLEKNITQDDIKHFYNKVIKISYQNMDNFDLGFFEQLGQIFKSSHSIPVCYIDNIKDMITDRWEKITLFDKCIEKYGSLQTFIVIPDTILNNSVDSRYLDSAYNVDERMQRLSKKAFLLELLKLHLNDFEQKLPGLFDATQTTLFVVTSDLEDLGAIDDSKSLKLNLGKIPLSGRAIAARTELFNYIHAETKLKLTDLDDLEKYLIEDEIDILNAIIDFDREIVTKLDSYEAQHPHLSNLRSAINYLGSYVVFRLNNYYKESVEKLNSLPNKEAFINLCTSVYYKSSLAKIKKIEDQIERERQIKLEEERRRKEEELKKQREAEEEARRLQQQKESQEGKKESEESSH